MNQQLQKNSLTRQEVGGCALHSLFVHPSMSTKAGAQQVLVCMHFLYKQVPRFVEHWCYVAADSPDDGTESEVMEKRMIAIIWSNRKRRKAMTKDDGRESRWQVEVSERISVVAWVPAVFANLKLL